MTSSTRKKTDKTIEPTATVVETQAVTPPPSPAKAPALIAYYAIPAPKGQPTVLAPIGSAIAHDDGAGFTLQLHLMPTAGGQVILRMPKANKAA